MKILVIHLLRLGDIIMATPILRGLRTEYPHAKIHLLINKEFAHIAPLIPFVDQFEYFDRQTYQAKLSEAGRPFLSSYDELDQLVTRLNQNKFQKVINLTQNKISGYLASVVGAEQKLGLVLPPGEAPQFGSSWFRYLNESPGGGTSFHFVDVFRFGSEIRFGGTSIELIETARGELEAASLAKDQGEFYLIQPSSNDSKKTWSAESWRQALKLVHQLEPGLSVGVLGSPQESEVVQDLVDVLNIEGIRAFSAMTSLEGSFSLLKRARLLITTDTSIKHLACATEAHIIELCLGSSDHQRSGAYKPGSLILKSKAACQPCPASQKCSQSSHVCSERLAPELVGMVAIERLRSHESNLSVLADEYQDEADILITQFSPMGFWCAQPVGQKFSKSALDQWVNQTSLKLYLQDEYQRPIGRYGTESQRLMVTLQNLFANIRFSEVESSLKELENYTHALNLEIARLGQLFHHAVRNSAPSLSLCSLSQAVHDLRLSWSVSGQKREFELRPKLDPQKKSYSFLEIRGLQKEISDLKRQSEIKLKLVRSMRLQAEFAGE